MSTMGLVTFGSFFKAVLLKRPAATAESDFESTQERRTGITPSTSVRNSRIYFFSSLATSFMMSPRVAVASLVR